MKKPTTIILFYILILLSVVVGCDNKAVDSASQVTAETVESVQGKFEEKELDSIKICIDNDTVVEEPIELSKSRICHYEYK